MKLHRKILQYWFAKAVRICWG